MLWIVGTLLALFCTVFRQQDVPQWPCDYNMPANLDSRWRWCCWSGRVKILVPPVWDSVWCSSYWGNIPAQLWKSCHSQCRLCRVPKIVVPLLKGNCGVIKSLFPHIRHHLGLYKNYLSSVSPLSENWCCTCLSKHSLYLYEESCSGTIIKNTVYADRCHCFLVLFIGLLLYRNHKLKISIAPTNRNVQNV